MSWSERYLQKKISTLRGAPTKPTKERLDGESGAFVGFVGARSLDRAGNFYADPDAPCPACGCGSFWRGKSGAWWCEQCAPPGDEHVCTWRNFSGGKVPSAPPPAEPWPADLDAMLRVATAFEWTRADVADFRQWARRSPAGAADARAFLEAEAARLPKPGLSDRRRVVLDMLAADPALRVAWTCADDGADPVRLVIAIRGTGACEMAIPRAKFDALALPQLIDRWNDPR